MLQALSRPQVNHKYSQDEWWIIYHPPSCLKKMFNPWNRSLRIFSNYHNLQTKITQKSTHRCARLTCITWLTCITSITCITCIICITCITCTLVSLVSLVSLVFPDLLIDWNSEKGESLAHLQLDITMVTITKEKKKKAREEMGSWTDRACQHLRITTSLKISRAKVLKTFDVSDGILFAFLWNMRFLFCFAKVPK